MSRIISKKHQDGREIVIGEISIKKSHNPNNSNEMVTVLKVYHSGLGSEEDLFVFHFNSLLKDWVLKVDKSFISMNMLSNHRLVEEVYHKISPSAVTTIQEFTDLLYDEHFDIFIEANTPTKVHKSSWFGWIKKLLRN